MNLGNILKGITTKLGTTSSSFPYYQEDNVPTDLGARRTTGYFTWQFDQEDAEANSIEHTGVVFGTLDIICYAVPHATRHSLREEILDLFFPLSGGKRQMCTPEAWGSAFMHNIQLVATNELFVEKTGAQKSETPGIMDTFTLKISA